MTANQLQQFGSRRSVEFQEDSELTPPSPSRSHSPVRRSMRAGRGTLGRRFFDYGMSCTLVR